MELSGILTVQALCVLSGEYNQYNKQFTPCIVLKITVTKIMFPGKMLLEICTKKFFYYFVKRVISEEKFIL